MTTNRVFYSNLANKIVGLIKKTDGLVTVPEIIEKSGGSESQVKRCLPKLMQSQRIKRYKIKGYKSYFYGLPDVDYSSFIQASGKAVETEILDPQSHDKQPKVTVTGPSILGLLKSMQETKWVPNNQKIQEYVPYSLAKVVRAATEVYAEGSSVSTAELMSIRADIVKYRDALYTAFKTINAIVETEPLWIGTEFAQFLLDGIEDIDAIRDMTHKVEQAQK